MSGGYWAKPWTYGLTGGFEYNTSMIIPLVLIIALILIYFNNNGWPKL